jgi:hypothetical protein
MGAERGHRWGGGANGLAPRLNVSTCEAAHRSTCSWKIGESRESVGCGGALSRLLVLIVREWAFPDVPVLCLRDTSAHERGGTSSGAGEAAVSGAVSARASAIAAELARCFERDAAVAERQNDAEHRLSALPYACGSGFPRRARPAV